MAYERHSCFLCKGYGKLQLGSNMRISKKIKHCDCIACDGKGFLNIWKDPWNWNNNFLNRDKK